MNNEQTYDEIEFSDEEASSPIEVELTELALQNILNNMSPEEVTAENLAWQLKQLFVFETEVIRIGNYSYEVHVTVGDEVEIIDVDFHPFSVDGE